MILLTWLQPSPRLPALFLSLLLSASTVGSAFIASSVFIAGSAFAQPAAPPVTPNAATATPPAAKPPSPPKPPQPKPAAAAPPAATPPGTAKPPATVATPTPADPAKTPDATDNAPAADGKRYTALVAFITLKVLNPTDTRKKLEQELKALGGFPVTVTDSALELKVPPAQLSVLLERIAAEGLVVDKALQREDLTLGVAKLSGQLKSKRAILAELRSFFDSSDVTATLHIESSMTELVEELESVKGALRVLHERSQWAIVHVNFEFKERQSIVSVASPFEWLNTVTLDRFLEAF
jgi:hypothetical protein